MLATCSRQRDPRRRLCALSWWQAVLLSGVIAPPIHGALADALTYSLGAHADAACVATASAALEFQPPGAHAAPFVQVSPGIRGGKISVGYGVTEIAGMCGPMPGQPIATLVGVLKASYLTCWRPVHRLDGIRHFVGAEIEAGLFANGSIGVFRSVQPHHGSEVLVLWSVGVGL